jgi:hypothetical protein
MHSNCSICILKHFLLSVPFSDWLLDFAHFFQSFLYLLPDVAGAALFRF